MHAPRGRVVDLKPNYTAAFVVACIEAEGDGEAAMSRRFGGIVPVRSEMTACFAFVTGNDIAFDPCYFELERFFDLRHQPSADAGAHSSVDLFIDDPTIMAPFHGIVDGADRHLSLLLHEA